MSGCRGTRSEGSEYAWHYERMFSPESHGCNTCVWRVVGTHRPSMPIAGIGGVEIAKRSSVTVEQLHHAYAKIVAVFLHRRVAMSKKFISKSLQGRNSNTACLLDGLRRGEVL